MWTEAGPLRQMRESLRAMLPPQAFLKRHRGEYLLVSNAPAFDPGLRDLPGFIAERRGMLLHILPDAGWIARYESRCEAGDHLTQSLARFRGIVPNRENIILFAQGAKLLDGLSGAAEAEISAYDRMLRQRAAIALRGGCGGGLYAAAAILAQITKLRGEQQS